MTGTQRHPRRRSQAGRDVLGAAGLAEKLGLEGDAVRERLLAALEDGLLEDLVDGLGRVADSTVGGEAGTFCIGAVAMRRRGALPLLSSFAIAMVRPTSSPSTSSLINP